MIDIDHFFCSSNNYQHHYHDVTNTYIIPPVSLFAGGLLLVSDLVSSKKFYCVNLRSPNIILTLTFALHTSRIFLLSKLETVFDHFHRHSLFQSVPTLLCHALKFIVPLSIGQRREKNDNCCYLWPEEMM